MITIYDDGRVMIFKDEETGEISIDIHEVLAVKETSVLQRLNSDDSPAFAVRKFRLERDPRVSDGEDVVAPVKISLFSRTNPEARPLCSTRMTEGEA